MNFIGFICYVRISLAFGFSYADDQQALFIREQWALSQKNTLTYGTRVDMHESFGTDWSPRTYLVHYRDTKKVCICRPF